MADKYIWSGATGTGDGSSWANAYTTLNAATAAGAGNTFYVAHDHSETFTANTFINDQGTAANPNRYLCVNRAGSVPPTAADLTTGATVRGNGNFNLQLAGNFYCYGIEFYPGFTSGGNSSSLVLCSTSTNTQQYENCNFALGGTGGTTISFAPNASGRLTLTNCTTTFSAAGQSIRAGSGPGSVTIWRNKPGSPAVLGTMPTNLFNQSSGGTLICSGLDLSSLGAGKTLYQTGGSGVQNATFINCKLNASVALGGAPFATSPISTAMGVRLIGCSSSGNVERNEWIQTAGSLTTETTIVRTAGASDGTTPFSWKLITTGFVKSLFALETFEGAIWNDAIGSPKTLTVHILTDNVTLKDDEIWLEVEYLGNASYPVATLVTDQAATVLTAGTNQAADTEAWTTTGLTTPVKQKLEVTFTPQMKGPIRWRVKLAKTSTTVYVDPKPDLT